MQDGAHCHRSKIVTVHEEEDDQSGSTPDLKPIENLKAAEKQPSSAN